jgi:hypothetical protein
MRYFCFLFLSGPRKAFGTSPGLPLIKPSTLEDWRRRGIKEHNWTEQRRDAIKK